jgi:hypothetical protein
MNGEWHVEPWVAVRVAGLPADVLGGLRLTRSREMAENLGREQELLAMLSRECVTNLFEAIDGCNDVPQRRLLLTLKRRLYSGKSIAPILEKSPAIDRLPPKIRGTLTDIASAEAGVDRAALRYESTYIQEMLELELALRDRIVGSDWLGEVLLSSNDLWNAAQWIMRAPPGVPVSIRQQKHEFALARYMFRAATRTVPFGGFAAVALISFERSAERAPAARPTTRADGVPHGRWHSTAHIHVDALERWVSRSLHHSSAANLPLRVSPVIKVSPGAPRVATFPLSGTRMPAVSWAEPFASEPGSVGAVSLGPLMQRVLDVAGGISTKAVCELLARSSEEGAVWRQLVDSMVETGLLTRDQPRTLPDHAGLLALSRRLDQLGDARLSGQVLEIAGLVADYPRTPAQERAKHLVDLNRTLGLDPDVVPLYVDKTLHGLTSARLGIALPNLRDIIRPALTLAHAVLSDEPHRWLCGAFLERFGPSGTCRDVPALLTDLIQDDRLMSNLRRISNPVLWMNSPLGDAIAEADKKSISLDPSLFESMDTPDGPCSLAAFVQLDAPNLHALRAGDYRVVLNGVQSGRYKYLSRYLGGRDPTAQLALAEVREKFASSADPMPVEIMPVLGLNFQVHPQLTSWALEIPGEPSPDPERTLPLSDLSLRFDSEVRQLKVSSTRLQRDIEPVHLGFLRDLNLPDQLLLIRALSPRISEDTVSERVKVYDVLDRSDAARKLPLRRYRPRLEAGRLVMERARWAIPLAEVPLQFPGESRAAFFRRLTMWRRDAGLPARGFVRRLMPGVAGAAAHTTPQYLDFNNPFTFAVIQRLATRNEHRLQSGWLLMRELLPSPENAFLTVNGRSHVSELLVQFEGGFADG